MVKKAEIVEEVEEEGEDFFTESEFSIDQKILTYVFEGEFNSENTINLVNFLNTNSSPINLFIDSIGGTITYIYIIATAIKSYNNDITIYPLYNCSSSAFMLLLNVPNPLVFLDKGIVSIVHFPRIDTFRDLNNSNIYPKDYFKKKRHDVLFNEQIKTLPLTPRDKKKLLRGQDVELYYKDLIEMFKDRIETEGDGE
jgi:hypothetical protein